MNYITRIFFIACLIFIGLTGLPINSSAQTSELTKEQKADLKNTQRLQKAKIDLGKSLEKLLKEQGKLEKMRTKFERDNKAGRLSPNDVEKITKKIESKEKAIEKLEETIANLEAFIKENEDGL